MVGDSIQVILASGIQAAGLGRKGSKIQAMQRDGNVGGKLHVLTLGDLEALDVQHECAREPVDSQHFGCRSAGLACRAQERLIALQALLLSECPETVLQPVYRFPLEQRGKPFACTLCPCCTANTSMCTEAALTGAARPYLLCLETVRDP
jgi:hypothetical protein